MMIDRPLNLFLNREPANDNERIAKAFLASQEPRQTLSRRYTQKRRNHG